MQQIDPNQQVREDRRFANQLQELELQKQSQKTADNNTTKTYNQSLLAEHGLYYIHYLQASKTLFFMKKCALF